MKIYTLILSLITAVGMAVQTAYAHHAVNAQFDNTKYIELKGILTNAELINPHSYFTLEVANEDGSVTSWEFESAAAAVVMRAGIPARELFQRGKEYTIIAHPARNGSATGLLTTMTLPDGRTVGFGGERSLRNEAANQRVQQAAED